MKCLPQPETKPIRPLLTFGNEYWDSYIAEEYDRPCKDSGRRSKSYPGLFCAHHDTVSGVHWRDSTAIDAG